MLAEYDKVKAIILLKKKELHLTDQDIAKMAGITRQTFGRMMTVKGSDDWKLGDIISICLSLGVSPEIFYDALDYERRNE